jgi:hypothetical protein
MKRRGNPATARNERLVAFGVHRHHRGKSKQASEFNPVA